MFEQENEQTLGRTVPEELWELIGECDRDLRRLVARMHVAPRCARSTVYLPAIDELLELRMMIMEAHE